MGLAAKREVLGLWLAAKSVGKLMVELEKPSFATPLPKLVDIGALAPITVRYLAPHPSISLPPPSDALARSACTVLAFGCQWR
jgi:hypothetical protein